ncbi:hypothetical protein MRY87_10960 [bacterium]|nr:hypothetical protein [bacterium]
MTRYIFLMTLFFFPSNSIWAESKCTPTSIIEIFSTGQLNYVNGFAELPPVVEEAIRDGRKEDIIEFRTDHLPENVRKRLRKSHLKAQEIADIGEDWNSDCSQAPEGPPPNSLRAAGSVGHIWFALLASGGLTVNTILEFYCLQDKEIARKFTYSYPESSDTLEWTKEGLVEVCFMDDSPKGNNLKKCLEHANRRYETKKTLCELPGNRASCLHK